ncbi:MAG: hypothetical protein LBV74_18820 [Tannerella sp.]|nr:hypothetical protein [Tannerella sp.]
MRFALSLYLEGIEFHSIGRLLNVSHVTVINWIKKFGLSLSFIRNSKPVSVEEPINQPCQQLRSLTGLLIP